MTSNRERIATLLTGIESGDPEPVEVVDEARYVQHNPMTKEGGVGLAELFARLSQTSPRVRTRGDGVESLRAALTAQGSDGRHRLRYDTVHRILAEGNFVLVAAEGAHDGDHAAIDDLFRLAGAVIVEHWGSIEEIPPRELWNNDNGKF